MSDRQPETGIVIALDGELATVRIETNSACSSCGANIFCLPGQDGQRTLVARNRIGAAIGQIVTVEETSDFLLKLSMYQYGYPMLGFAAGILIPYLLKLNLFSMPPELTYFGGGIIGLVAMVGFSHRGIKKIADKNAVYFEITA